MTASTSPSRMARMTLSASARRSRSSAFSASRLGWSSGMRLLLIFLAAIGFQSQHARDLIDVADGADDPTPRRLLARQGRHRHDLRRGGHARVLVDIDDLHHAAVARTQAPQVADGLGAARPHAGHVELQVNAIGVEVLGSTLKLNGMVGLCILANWLQASSRCFPFQGLMSRPTRTRSV